ncbi:MAG: beta strand repeat-containing protein, partial [Isosphaeraceae bacterium]
MSLKQSRRRLPTDDLHASRHLARPRLEVLEERTLLTTFVVSNPNATDDLTSLQGILASPTLAPGDVITFDNADVSTISTIGTFFVPAGITITNTGNTPITIEGSGSHNDFEILPFDASNVQDPNNFSDTSTTTLNGLNIIGGGLGSDVEIPGGGGVYFNSDGNKDALSLKITDCSIDENGALTGATGGGAGGGLDRGEGGGVYYSGNGTLSMLNSTISNNVAGFAGGGIFATAGKLTIACSTIADNTVDDTDGRGGGIFAPDLELQNTIVATNGGPGPVPLEDLLAETIQSLGNNLIGVDPRPFFNEFGIPTDINFSGSDLIGVDISQTLGFLGFNDGTTMTQALLPGNPAIDHGSNNIVDFPTPLFDEQGDPRIVNGTMDIGAYELQSNADVEITPSDNPAVFDEPVTFQVNVSDDSGNDQVPTGSVQLQIDGGNVGNPVTLDANGDATFPDVSDLSAGTHTVVVIYSGDSNFLGVNAPLPTLVVQPAVLAFENPPTTLVAGQIFDQKVEVEDENGDIDTTYSGTVGMILNSTTGVALEGTTTVSVNDGIADFTDLQIPTPGAQYSLTAISDNATMATTEQFPVTEDHLDFTQLPNPMIVGRKNTIVVTLENANDEPDSSLDGQTVQLNADPNNEADDHINLIDTSTTLQNGVATFSGFMVFPAGTGYTIVAQAPNAESVTSNPFDAVNDAFQFTQQPANREVVGQPFTPQVLVSLMTPQGIPDSGFDGQTVTLSLEEDPSNGKAKLSGNTAILQGGVAVFPNLSLDTEGDGYVLQATITASADDLTPGKSSAFDVVPSQILHWTGSGDGDNWSDPKNWQEKAAPDPNDNNTLIFPATGAPLSSTNNISDLTLEGIDIEGGGYKLSGNSVALLGTLTSASGSNTYSIPTTLGGGSVTINVATLSKLEITSPLNGPGGLTLTGGGTLLLDQSNTYTGDTTISNGTLALATNDALGIGTLHLAGGTLQSNATGVVSLDNPIRMEANSTINVGNGLIFQGSSPDEQPTVTVAANCSLNVAASDPQGNALTLGNVSSQTSSSATPFTLSISSDDESTVEIGGLVDGSLSANGDVDLVVVADPGSVGAIVAGGQPGDDAIVELGGDLENLPLSGSDTITAEAGGTVKGLIANPNFSGTVILDGGTVKVGVDNGLGTGTIQVGLPNSDRSAAVGLLQNISDGEVDLGNALKFYQDATFSVGAGMSFGDVDDPAPPGVEIAANSSLTVTGQTSASSSPALVFFGKITSDTDPVSHPAPFTLDLFAASGVPVECNGEIAGFLDAEGSTDLTLFGNLDSGSAVLAGGQPSDQSVVELNDSTGSGRVTADAGCTVKGTANNSAFAGTIVLNGGTVKVDTGNGLGTGTIQVGTAQTGDSSAGLLQNSSSEAIGLVNSIEFLASATFSVGQGLQFNAPDQPGSPPPVEVAANCTLTVTSQNSSEGPPFLEFADDLLSDTDSGSQPFALDVQAISPAEVDLGGAIAGTVNAGGTTDLSLTGNLVAGASITADNQSTVELGFAAQQIPVTGSGTLTVFHGATIKALTANPNFSGKVVLGGGTVQVGVSNGLGTATIQTNAIAGNILTNTSDTVLQLPNSFNFMGDLTLNLGPGMNFAATGGTSQPGIEIAASSVLTVNGSNPEQRTLSFAGELTSDENGVVIATLTIESGAGVLTRFDGIVAG